ncbi:urea ABC transporter ATP-binding subunit UrtE [Billgrantia ethanolica]|uniref:Urea ABC transporter ATP-binding subunit UrtE n=1 Tax=Billgrantia ethanolica TaxID=2733486 RepID=A0ABS9A570_9GAMM|nr:urea ABC transporter ATP-binding subunit UrtE [Halomonas ethanolica]MCE8003195.1 urea ABC transporter ATP-binding subunit UrtE [Halomonas ethanolica]
MLEARDLYSFYGKSPVLQGVNFKAGKGELFSILGRNGVGKTTLLKSIMGLTDGIKGTLRLKEESIGDLPTPERARRRIGYIPQGRAIIPRFTVKENILMGAFGREDGRREMPEGVLELFPILKEFMNRRGGDLSGGQQQQLAIARALALGPEVLLLDEPTEGIQPNIVQQIEEVIVHLNKKMGITILLVEQNIPFARRVSDKFIVLDKGRVAVAGSAEDLTDDVAHEFLAF